MACEIESIKSRRAAASGFPLFALRFQYINERAKGAAAFQLSTPRDAPHRQIVIQ